MTTKTYGTIRWTGENWSIEAQPDVMMRVKRIFPRIRATKLGHIVTVDHTDEVARDLEWLLARFPMVISPGDEERLTTSADAHRDRGERVTDILSGTAVHHDLPLEPAEVMTPRDYQRVAYDLARASGALLLADDLGLGKTLSGLLALSDPNMRPMLAVTLTGLPRQWAKEMRKTYPDLIAHEVTKATPYDLTDENGRTPDLIVMNYAKLAGWAGHLRGVVRSVVFDEVQELRRDGSQKHAAAASVAQSTSLAMGLSATPIYNYGGEMYSILSVLAPDRVGRKEEFAREWCLSTYGLDPKTRIHDPKAFRQWMIDQGIFLRRTRGDVGISLPGVSMIEQYVDHDRKKWEEASGDALEIARLLLDQNATRQQRWSAAGDFDWRMRQATGLAKAPYVTDFSRLVLESEEKIILTAWHRAVWDVYQDRLGEYRPVLYTGSESAAQKAQAFEQFTEGDSRVLLISLRSGAGLDGLQGVCNTVVFGELDWSPGVHKQVIGRVARPGQMNAMQAYFCISDEGSDPPMADVLNIKQMEADMLIDPSADAGAVEIEEKSGHIQALAERVLAQRRAA